MDNTSEPDGRAVQVDPIKPTLKAPGTKRLKLKYDEPLLSFGFKFKLRRYTTDPASPSTNTVGTHGSCLPCHQTRCEPSVLELNGIL
jgi:hypothetical protein